MSDDSDDDIPIALLMKKKMEAEKAKKLAAVSGGSTPSLTEKDKQQKKRPNGASLDENPKKKDKKTPQNSVDKEKSSSTENKKKELSKSEISKKKDTGDKSSTPNGNAEAKKAKKEKSKTDSKRDESSKKERSSTKSAPRDSVVPAAAEENIFGLDRMDKHNLVSAVLRRWKYCLDHWPGQLPAEPPHGYIEAHVPGVYVGSSNLVLGQLKDMRPFLDCKTPSMASLLKYKAVELKDLLVKGINTQISLLGTSAEDSRLQSKLNHELEKAGKLKVKKIERKYREAVAALTGEVLPKQDKSSAEKDDE
jgi:hypothetical protein